MTQEEFLTVIESQDEKNVRMVSENLKEVIEAEFVLSNVFVSYLDFLERNAPEDIYSKDLNELMKQGGPPTKKLLDFDIGRQMREQSMYLHKHTYLEADYVYQGNCTYYIENESNSFVLKEKELCIVNQNVVHGIDTVNSDCIVIKCMIPFSYIDLNHYKEMNNTSSVKNFLVQALDENRTNSHYMVFRIRDTSYVEEQFYAMCCEFLNKKPGWRNVVRNHLSNFFLYLIREEKEELILSEERKEENLNISRLLECIRRNYQYITLKDLAEDFHFHENYLSRLIRKQCQVSFRELLTQIRLKEAEKMLMESNLSVREIAEQIGYQKPNFFFRMFKEHYGMTPMEFRNSRE